MKINLLEKFVKNRAGDENSPENAQISKMFYKMVKSLKS
jgi:hypothetical protein